MSRVRYSFGAGAVLLFLAFLISRDPLLGRVPDTLPAVLSDREFWSLTERISEPDGFFRSNSGSTDNLLSNEGKLSAVAAAIATRVGSSGVYLGVGPEQTYTYIEAKSPSIVLINDICCVYHYTPRQPSSTLGLQVAV